ncbi:MAG: hypothetical protein OEZ16_10670 [Chromatiales bacterium]|nr:hypothetical protein [Chromatiales bacterium]
MADNAQTVGNKQLTKAFLGTMLLFTASILQVAQAASEPKMLSGISIVGNDEAPKSLFIVPWKSSEIGFETNLNSDMMDGNMRPVDRDVFMREIDFHAIRQTDGRM